MANKTLSDVSVSHTANISIVLVTTMALLVLFGSFYFLTVALQNLLTGGG